MISMVIMMFISAFCFALGLFLPDIISSLGIGTDLFILIVAVPSILIYLFVFLSMIKSRMKISGGIWQVSFAVYIYAMAQEVFTIVRVSTPSVSLIDVDIFSLPGFWLMGWYFVGAFVVIFGGAILGKIVDSRFSSISAQHIPTMKEKFGPNAPNELKFSDGSSLRGDYGAAFCAASGVIYSIWMLLRHVLLP